MPVSLACRCGNQFEVEEIFAGQFVQCPQCQQSLRAPSAARTPLRTSGFAITSVICALLLGLTVVGPLLAVIFGVIALISISRHRDRLTGAGYAVFGIVGGILFLGVSILAFTHGEVFVALRTQFLLGDVDTSGPMEVIKAHDGFAITRPTPRWGIAGQELMHSLGEGYALMLVEPGKDAYMGIQAEGVRWLSAQQYRDQVLQQFEAESKPNAPNAGLEGPRLRGLHVRLLRTVHPPGPDGTVFTAEEAVLDVRMLGQPITFLIRFLREKRTSRLFAIRAWCSRRQYERMEPVFLQAMNSFRRVPLER